MSGQNHYIDNDALVKLAGYELFDEFLALRGISRFKVYRLGTIASVFAIDSPVLSPKLKDERHRLQVRRLLREVHPATTALAANRNRALLMSRQVDIGEAILMSRAVEDIGSYFVTGDKRALRHLADDPKLSEIAKALQGRCVHLEQVILGCLRRNPGLVQCNVGGREPNIDTAIGDALCGIPGSSRPNLSQSMQILEESIERLRVETGSLLFP